MSFLSHLVIDMPTVLTNSIKLPYFLKIVSATGPQGGDTDCYLKHRTFRYQSIIIRSAPGRNL